MNSRALISDPIASTLSSASVAFARNAIELSGEYDFHEVEEFSTDYDTKRIRVAEQTIGAIIVSVAAIESLINEIIGGSVDPIYRDQPPGQLSRVAYKRWGRMWQKGVFQKLGILDKCQVALELADLQPIPTDKGVFQDTTALISLRNELVHAETKYRPYGQNLPPKERNSLEKKLKGKFPENRLAQKTAPYIWQRCLGLGCAKWAVETKSAFQNVLFDKLGITILSNISWEDTREGA